VSNGKAFQPGRRGTPTVAKARTKMTAHEAVTRFLEAVQATKQGNQLAASQAAVAIVLGGRQLETLMFAAQCVASLITADPTDIIAALEALEALKQAVDQ
jgi:hypothetical protein